MDWIVLDLLMLWVALVEGNDQLYLVACFLVSRGFNFLDEVSANCWRT